MADYSSMEFLERRIRNKGLSILTQLPAAGKLKKGEGKNVKKMFCLVALIFMRSIGLAQPGIDSTTYAQLKNQLLSIYGSSSWLDNVINIDSSRHNDVVADGLVEDPYGTLTGCYVFVGHLPVNGDMEKLFVGVFRNNQIAWRSDTMVSAILLTAGHIFATRDLNRDGNVEIIVSWLFGPRLGAEYLWVYTWSGQTGAMITATDDKGFSTIVSLAGVVRFADVQGDGIWEIQGGWQDGDSLTTTLIDTLITYSWDGQRYGKWPSTPQPTIFDWLPMSSFQATVKATVAPMNNELRYSYRFKNESSSLQTIDEVIIDYRVDSVRQVNGPSDWDFYGAVNSIHPGWKNTVSPPFRNIQAGQTDSSFGYESSGFPAISHFYLLGGNADPLALVSNSSWENNILTNSINGFTIVPADPPTPFTGLTFLDTLKSYVTQSRSLGWITSDPTANKYKRLIDTAHSYLQENIRGVTKAKLDSILINVHTDSASALTSEAYALIRFNTEYVLNKLREEDSTFAVENKSSSAVATASNSARHLAKTGNYLHEVFASGGEIFYRRSGDGGSTWDQTHQINTAIGDNSLPCITATHNNYIQIVWQRRITTSTYEVWHSYSQDDGANWSTAMLPDAGGVGVSGYQIEGPMPVIAEGRYLVVVYCSNEGLRYRVSEDDGATWQVPETDTISGEYNNRVQSPSLAGGDSYVSLVYNYADDTHSPWSRTFDGRSWSDESTVGKGTDISDAEFSCVAIDGDQNPITAWTGTSTNMTWGKVIVFRSGYSNNTWSDWFTIFGQNFVDRLNPSLTYYNGNNGYGVGIVHHTSQNFIKLIKLTEVDPPTWDISTLSESGAWASIAQETSSSGVPIYCWTDQSTVPFEVIVGSGELARGKVAGNTNIQGVSQKRRAVVYHRRLRATLALEFEPMKVVLANGDTTIVPFKKSSLRQRGKINYSNMWDYLGSDTLSVPVNARRLVVSKQFDLRGPSIAQRKFFLRVLNANGTSIAVLDSTSTSGSVSVNIAPYVGMKVILHPQLSLGGIESASLDIGVGDVFTLPDESLKQSQPKMKRLR